MDHFAEKFRGPSADGELAGFHWGKLRYGEVGEISVPARSTFEVFRPVELSRALDGMAILKAPGPYGRAVELF